MTADQTILLTVLVLPIVAGIVCGVLGQSRAPLVRWVALSASIRIAANPPHGTTAEELWRAAGEALMRAKRTGRDRVALHVEEKMILKSNYYSKAHLERLAKLSRVTDRTEASLLREALDDLLYKHRNAL